ncbi:MAG: NAD(P)/FAD-dependent oxidoreductase [Candidatus Omnitrophica bacterium]|nr:NAD(P)/FAD-dependent oxidoreductase [Candidatus Omnitrophota bacterium]
MNKNNYDVIVVGGGASGMMAAGRAAELGARMALVERGNCLGRKLLNSGKGRCNLTNIGELNEFLGSFGKTGNFLRNTFHRFFSQELMEFFQNRGLKLKIERGGRVFPESDKASAVVGILTNYLLENKVKILLNSRVRCVLLKDKCIEGVKLINGEIIGAKKIILACGGKSYSLTGSTGDGYLIAKELGHAVTKLRPALVPLEIKEKNIFELQGLSLDNVRINVIKDEKTIISEFGDMLFTHFGISGPIILSISSEVSSLLETEKEVCISFDLKPALDRDKLTQRIIRDTKNLGNKNLNNYFKELLPNKMIKVFLNFLKVNSGKKLNQLTKEEREGLVSLLKDFRLTVTKTRPIEEAIVTRGGVSIKEINPKTMESKIISGLYFCGEVIDIDAKTGGYNLQAAFSTGYVAGESAASSK